MIEIKINNKLYRYEEEELSIDRIPLDRKIAFENLSFLTSLFNKEEMNYFIFYGTLLGIIRENDFIEYDTDTDIVLFYKDKDKFLELIPSMDEYGFKIVRFTENIISIMKENEYIDLYFFQEKRNLLLRKIWYCQGLVIKYNILSNFKNYQFKNINVKIPENYNKALKYLYGKNWKIPIKNYHAKRHTKFTRLIIKIIPKRIIELLKKKRNTSNKKNSN